MDKDLKHSPIPQSEPADGDLSPREQQAQAIMQQLVSEGLFSPEEVAEITFSDAQFICIPDNNQPAD